MYFPVWPLLTTPVIAITITPETIHTSYSNYYKYTPSYNYNCGIGMAIYSTYPAGATKPEPTQPEPVPEEPATRSTGLTADEQQMINLVNQERKAQGLNH